MPKSEKNTPYALSCTKVISFLKNGVIVIVGDDDGSEERVCKITWISDTRKGQQIFSINWKFIFFYFCLF